MRAIWDETASPDPRGFLFFTTRIMQLTGILKTSSKGRWAKLYSLYSVIIFTLIFVQMSSQIMDFILHSRTITTVVQNGVFTLLSVNSVFKAYWLLWRKRTVLSDLLCDMTDNFRLKAPTKELKRVANGPVTWAYYSFLGQTSMAYVFWMSSPFLQYATVLYRHDGNGNRTVEPIQIYDMEYPLPARAWFPVEVFYHPMFYVAYGFQFVSLTYIVFISISVDLLCIVSLLRINAQLIFLAADIEMASESAFLTVARARGETYLLTRDIAFKAKTMGSSDAGTPVKEFVMELTQISKDCVRYHTDIIRVIRRLDSILGGLALVTTRLYTLVLVVGAMKIVDVRGVDSQTVQLMAYCSCFIYQLYLFFSPADDIINSQHQLANAVEVGLWGPIPTSNRELGYIIKRITMMANKPAEFTAGYLQMNRTSYRKELQHAASMFNALWQIKAERT